MIQPEKPPIIAPVPKDVLRELARGGVAGEHAKLPRGLQRHEARKFRHHIAQQVLHGGHDAQPAAIISTHAAHEKRGKLAHPTVIFEGSAHSLPPQQESRLGSFRSVVTALQSVDARETRDLQEVATSVLSEIATTPGAEAFAQALGNLSTRELQGLVKLQGASLAHIGLDKVVSYVKNYAPKGTIAALKESMGQVTKLVETGDPADRVRAQKILTDLFNKATKSHPDAAWPLALSAVGLGSAALVLKRAGRSLTAAKLGLIELALLAQGCAGVAPRTVDPLPSPQVGITHEVTPPPPTPLPPTEVVSPTAAPSEVPVTPAVIPPEITPQPVSTEAPHQAPPMHPDYRSPTMFRREGYQKGYTVKELQAMVDGEGTLPQGWTVDTARILLNNTQDNFVPLFNQIGTDPAETRVFTDNSLQRNTVIGYKFVNGRWYMTCAAAGGVASYRCDSRSPGWFDAPPTETPKYTLLGLPVGTSPDSQVVKFANTEFPVYATLDSADTVANVLALGPKYEFVDRNSFPKEGATVVENGKTYYLFPEVFGDQEFESRMKNGPINLTGYGDSNYSDFTLNFNVFTIKDFEFATAMKYLVHPPGPSDYVTKNLQWASPASRITLDLFCRYNGFFSDGSKKYTKFRAYYNNFKTDQDRSHFFADINAFVRELNEGATIDVGGVPWEPRKGYDVLWINEAVAKTDSSMYYANNFYNKVMVVDGKLVAVVAGKAGSDIMLDDVLRRVLLAPLEGVIYGKTEKIWWVDYQTYGGLGGTSGRSADGQPITTPTISFEP